jgi:hypothetical protein
MALGILDGVCNIKLLKAAVAGSGEMSDIIGSVEQTFGVGEGVNAILGSCGGAANDERREGKDAVYGGDIQPTGTCGGRKETHS